MLVFKYRSERYPTYRTILELQNKIAKLQTSGLISQKSIANLCMRMSEGCIGKTEVNRLLTLSADDLIEYLNDENEKDEIFIVHEKEMNEAKETAQKLSDDNLTLRVKIKIKDNRMHSILYILGVIVVYIVCLRIESLKLEDNWINILLHFMYWVFMSIGFGYIKHGYFWQGILSFFNYDSIFNKYLDEEKNK